MSEETKRTTIKDVENQVLALKAVIDVKFQELESEDDSQESVDDTKVTELEEHLGRVTSRLTTSEDLVHRLQGFIEALANENMELKQKMEGIDDNIRNSTLDRRVTLLSQVLSCVLLTKCRGIESTGWEGIVKRYWKTNGGMVWKEDLAYINELVNNTDVQLVLQKFIDLSFEGV